MKHQFDPRHKALIAVIQEARQRAGLSQRDLSLKLKRSRSFINRVELGDRVLDFLEAIDVAEALGIDPTDFVDRVLSHGKPGPEIEKFEVSMKHPKARRKPK